MSLVQLTDAVVSWRAVHPSHVVFVVGDFNIIGEGKGYNEHLTNHLGIKAGGRDADRNSPGFVLDGSKSYTSSIANKLATYLYDDTVNARLDYIYYFPSLDGSVEVVPAAVDVVPFRGRYLSEDDFTTNESSDHYAVDGKFVIYRK